MLTVPQDMLGESGPFDCAHCGRRSWTLWCYVEHAEHGAHAVVYMGVTEGHTERQMAISVGGWGEGADPADKRCACLHLVPSDQGLKRALVSPDEVGVHAPLLGPPIGQDDDFEPFRAVLYAVLDQDERMNHAFWHGTPPGA